MEGGQQCGRPQKRARRVMSDATFIKHYGKAYKNDETKTTLARKLGMAVLTINIRLRKLKSKGRVLPQLVKYKRNK